LQEQKQFPKRPPLPAGDAKDWTKTSVRFVPEPLLDTAEAAAIMKISPKTLQKLARMRRIRGIHVGKLWRFRASEIDAWIEREMAS
jgi:excisionase family DNA binding protein